MARKKTTSPCAFASFGSFSCLFQPISFCLVLFFSYFVLLLFLDVYLYSNERERKKKAEDLWGWSIEGRGTVIRHFYVSGGGNYLKKDVSDASKDISPEKLLQELPAVWTGEAQLQPQASEYLQPE